MAELTPARRRARPRGAKDVAEQDGLQAPSAPADEDAETVSAKKTRQEKKTPSKGVLHKSICSTDEKLKKARLHLLTAIQVVARNATSGREKELRDILRQHAHLDFETFGRGSDDTGGQEFNRVGYALLAMMDTMSGAMAQVAAARHVVQCKDFAHALANLPEVARKFGKKRPSLARSAASKKRAEHLHKWQQAVAQARKETGGKKWMPVKKGSKLYARVKEIRNAME